MGAQPMAMKRKQQGQAPPQRPQFFRILLPGFSQRMTIPQTFSKYIAGQIQEKATLMSPLGKSWPVGVHRATNFFYFGEGWPEFCRVHGLNVGCFLVFGYEGEMVFTVTVFDQSTCMKEYGPEGGDNIELNPSESRRQRICLQSMDSRNHSVNPGSIGTEGSQFEIIISSYNPRDEPSLPLPQEFIRYVGEDNSRLATIFSPAGEPWHIEIRKDSKGLQFADGWQRFVVAHNLSRGDSLVFKHKGALIFDVAIFDNRICETEHNLDVASGVENGLDKLPALSCCKSVSEATEPNTGKHQSVEMEEVIAQNQNSKAQDVMNGSARRPHFQVVINLSTHNRKYALGMPRGFIETNGLSRVNWWLLRDPNGRLWPVRLNHKGRSRSKIQAGWREFCVGNNLHDGDVCLFEFKEKNELRVKIHRKRHPKFISVLKNTSGKPRRPLCAQTAPELAKSEIYHRLNQSTRINPVQEVSELVKTCIPQSQFATIISRSKLFGKANLNIPRSFLASVDLSTTHRIILLDPKSRQWPVNVYHCGLEMNPKAKIGYGWKAFCTSNNVEIGDKCIFELASRVKNDVFHVRIIKRKAAAFLDCLATGGRTTGNSDLVASSITQAIPMCDCM